ncbi:DUF3954 domain-containing protein [Rummeliibacillus pycnus]|uniref:DUF3954 domain-containing protein n=1 Tax=Rummeliibacillus pycnus TaxID=101070 RepID=UPI001FE85D95|nr:DUF3954 domain-containing protein [Rummeliibacillus pycnus]
MRYWTILLDRWGEYNLVAKKDEVTEIDPDMIAEIDLHENAVYVVCDGQLKVVDPPSTGYGKQEISWHNGMPTHSEIKYTLKF